MTSYTLKAATAFGRSDANLWIAPEQRERVPGSRANERKAWFQRVGVSHKQHKGSDSKEDSSIGHVHISPKEVKRTKFT